jgi:hypothetical protein
VRSQIQQKCIPNDRTTLAGVDSNKFICVLHEDKEGKGMSNQSGAFARSVADGGLGIPRDDGDNCK